MKLKLCPSKQSVLDILSASLGSARAKLFSESEELTNLESGKSGSHLYNPYADTKIAVAKDLVAALSADVERLEQQIAMVNNHEAPKVMVEMDL